MVRFSTSVYVTDGCRQPEKGAQNKSLQLSNPCHGLNVEWMQRKQDRNSGTPPYGAGHSPENVKKQGCIAIWKVTFVTWCIPGLQPVEFHCPSYAKIQSEHTDANLLHTEVATYHFQSRDLA